MTGHTNIPEQPRVLVVGGGAREHAIVWKLANSPRQPKLFAAPGNPGMAELCTLVPIPVHDMVSLVGFAQQAHIDLVVIGPEQPLSLGLADAFQAVGVRVFGPSQAAAQLEASKSFAKSLMQRAGVPTAAYAVFDDESAAVAYLRGQDAPVVVKADGLAAGKGVVVAQTIDDAIAAVEDMMVHNRFGQSGARVVIESFLTGTEVSLMYFVDRMTAIPMVPARDHKRVFDGDLGPNTGGMGAFAPVAEVVDDGWMDVIGERIIAPTLAALAADGIVYQGVLYVGLMMTPDGPQVVEFNARFGDPETEVVLPLLASDLLDICWLTAEGRLTAADVAWIPGSAVCIVLAAPGYPEAPQIGSPIDFSKHTEGIVFHAGTAAHGDDVVTAGGRVLAAVGVAAALDAARSIAYRTADAIYFEGKHCRRDIATRVGL